MLHSKIEAISVLEILDSRGTPTLQVSITTDQNKVGIASVPSGASTGEHEALELRDKDAKRYHGKGVLKAMEAIHKHLTPLLMDKNVFDQQMLDRLMCDSDGTENKSHYGANAILGCSLAIAKAAALTAGMPLYRYLGGPFASLLPCPMMNLINGGAHADNGLDFQEFMIRPVGAGTFAEGVRWGSEIFHTLKALLKEKNLSTAVGDEGGFAPAINSPEKALDLLMQAIEKAGFRPKDQISLALDCAASEFYDKKTKTYKGHTAEKQIELLASLTKQYPIDSIEDGMAEDDWEGWRALTKTLGDKIQLVGDDIFVTNTQFLRKGLKLGIANAILIKVNQIGTLTETAECVKLAQVHGYTTIISHRSGETEDTSISDLSVAFSSGQIKTGSLSRSERTAKYNRLLAIESELGCQALYRDSNRCRTLGRACIANSAST